MFWGCTIPARFPFIEKATRLVLGDLGVKPRELPGHTCCPEGGLVKDRDHEVFTAVAGRNLAIVETAGLDVLTPCSGCYATFRETAATLRRDRTARDRLDELLADEELEYRGRLQIVHLAQWLADTLGPDLIARRANVRLRGLRLGVHYGCHLLRPQPAVRWDDPLRPRKVEDLVSALGATVVDYPTKLECCGGALDRIGERDACLSLAERKLRDVQDHDVDALVVVCPSCFQQFDLNQAALKRAGADVHVPALYLSELLALAFGHSPEEIGIGMHRVDASPFLEKWETLRTGREHVAGEFDLPLIDVCADCAACRDDCPVAAVDESFRPTEVVERLAAGDLDGAVADPQIWKCVGCHTCRELCHSGIGLEHALGTLKRLAAADGHVPDAAAAAYDGFLETGVLGTPKERARTRLGLEPLPASDTEAVGRLLDRLGDGSGGGHDGRVGDCATPATDGRPRDDDAQPDPARDLAEVER